MICAALGITATAAVALWIVVAAAGVPPLRVTITASPTAMILAAPRKAASKCGAQFANRTVEYGQPVLHSRFDIYGRDRARLRSRASRNLPSKCTRRRRNLMSRGWCCDRSAAHA